MMKLRCTIFCTLRPVFMDFRGSVKIFSVKGGCQNLEMQGYLLSSVHHKNSGGVETPVRAMPVSQRFDWVLGPHTLLRQSSHYVHFPATIGPQKSIIKRNIIPWISHA